MLGPQPTKKFEREERRPLAAAGAPDPPAAVRLKLKTLQEKQPGKLDHGPGTPLDRDPRILGMFPFTNRRPGTSGPVRLRRKIAITRQVTRMPVTGIGFALSANNQQRIIRTGQGYASVFSLTLSPGVK